MERLESAAMWGRSHAIQRGGCEHGCEANEHRVATERAARGLATRSMQDAFIIYNRGIKIVVIRACACYLSVFLLVARVIDGCVVVVVVLRAIAEQRKKRFINSETSRGSKTSRDMARTVWRGTAVCRDDAWHVEVSASFRSQRREIG